jgi:hypothetical protein
MPGKLDRSVRIKMEEDMHRAIRMLADADGRSWEGMCRKLIAEALHRYTYDPDTVCALVQRKCGEKS